MSPTNLTSMPRELHLCIIDYITSKTDLRSLCLSCKTLNDVATAPLYQSMVISVDYLASESAKLSRVNNPGLTHVRSLKVIRSSRGYEPAVHDARLMRILRTLPCHKLRDFRLPPYLDPIGELSRFVVRTQHNLQSYQMQSSGASFRMIHLPEEHALQSVTTLDINLQSFADYQRASWILMRAIQVRNLILHAGDGPWPEDAANDHMPQPYFRILFANLGDEGRKLAIRSLVLHHVYLRWNSATLADGIELSGLKSLILQECMGAHSLFPHIEAAKPNLEELILVRSTEYNHHTPVEFNDLLLAVSGLKRISASVITLKGAKRLQVEWNGLQHHRHTIRSIHLDVASSYKAIRLNLSSAEEIKCFEEAIEPFMQLEHLAFGIKHPIKQGCWWTPSPSLSQFARALLQLPNLKVLDLHVRCTSSILGVEIFRPEKLTDDQLMVYKHYSQDIANAIFRSQGEERTSLRAVVIEPRRVLDDCTATVKRFGYLRGQSLDIFGQSRPTAIPIEPHMIKHHVPYYGSD